MRYVCALVAAAVSAASAQIQFEEIAQKAGLNFQLRNGAQGRLRQSEPMAGGVTAL
jgi:hypothetical protein